MLKHSPISLLLLFLSVCLTPIVFAQPNPCGVMPIPEPGIVYVGQDCSVGEWYVSADYGYASGLIVASAPLKITEKFAPDGLWNGELVSMNDGKIIRFFLDNFDVTHTGFRFSAPVGTQVALLPDYGYGYFSIGGNPADSYSIVNLTDPAIPHLFIVNPREGQHLNKGEHKKVTWVSSAHFDKVNLAISRAPSQTTWIRSPDGQTAFNIDNSGEFLWDVLRINNVCHEFYLKIGGYANDGSGYHQSTSEVFNVLHAFDYGIQCQPTQK